MDPKTRLTLIWEGCQSSLHSYAVVNRNFREGLKRSRHQLSLVPCAQRNDVGLPALKVSVRQPLTTCNEIYIRHTWPPNFTPPAQGHWIMIQPWEFGSLPVAWVRQMVDLVDEIWAYSGYVKSVYVRSGVPAERVQVVPLGVDLATFRPEGPRFPLMTRKRFKFLFVGGTIFRKGFDVLLAAYSAAFTRNDEVCLVVKDLGGDSFYQGQTAGRHIAQFQANPQAPEIEYLTAPLSPEDLGGLYRACDCLVHPYRGEGFGLPIAEAMASGLPVIVTGMGAALDYCNPANAFLIPAQKKYFRERRVGQLETVDLPWLAEPDGLALRPLLRHVASDPAERQAKAQAGCAHIRSHFSWDQAVAVAEKRLLALRETPVRRFAQTSSQSRRRATVKV
jgi:glycosyltransferase involved in cell wall biosynthesis